MTELGGTQISSLMEVLPGIAQVLRSPVADAIVNTAITPVQFTQSGGHGFAIDAQMLRDLLMRQIFDGVFVGTFE